jgi:hypothetical protein
MHSHPLCVPDSTHKFHFAHTKYPCALYRNQPSQNGFPGKILVQGEGFEPPMLDRATALQAVEQPVAQPLHTILLLALFHLTTCISLYQKGQNISVLHHRFCVIIQCCIFLQCKHQNSFLFLLDFL